MPNSRRIYDVTKVYPDMRITIDFKTPFDVPLGEKREKKTPGIIKNIKDFRSERRSKTEVKDIVLCNDFEHFCTFTFDPKKMKSRYDISVCKLVMHRWLELQRKKYGRFRYLIVAEYHKDRAIHFHALFAGYKGPLSDSGKKDKGDVVYNLSAWRYGFSTAKTIRRGDDDRGKVAAYLTKYITKDMPVFAGKKRYWVSQSLRRPERSINTFLTDARYIVRRKLYCLPCAEKSIKDYFFGRAPIVHMFP